MHDKTNCILRGNTEACANHYTIQHSLTVERRSNISICFQYVYNTINKSKPRIEKMASFITLYSCSCVFLFCAHLFKRDRPWGRYIRMKIRQTWNYLLYYVFFWKCYTTLKNYLRIFYNENLCMFILDSFCKSFLSDIRADNIEIFTSIVMNF